MTVAVYIVVVLGDTVLEPPTIESIVPTPLLIEPLVALFVVHESVEEFPEVIVPGFTERIQLGAFGTAVTVTVV